MTTVGKLRKSIDTARELSELVGTMETLAAVNIRQYESTVRAIDQYVSTIELGFQIVLRTTPEVAQGDATTRGRTGVIVFGTDQGLCGSINSRLARRVRELYEENPDSFVVPVGHRIAQLLDDIELGDELRPPQSVSGIAGLVADVLGMLGDWQDSGRLRDIVVVYNRPRNVAKTDADRESVDRGAFGGGFETLHERLLPLDPNWLQELARRPWKARGQPTFGDDPEQLYAWLVREWLFARLYLACAASLAAENGSRLETTQAAGASIDERLHSLRRRYRSLRQTTITEELMDLFRG